jgi:hypothetical protein
MPAVRVKAGTFKVLEFKGNDDETWREVLFIKPVRTQKVGKIIG